MTGTTAVAEAVTGWVGSILGVPTAFGEFPAGERASAMVRASPGSPVVRSYQAGGGLYRFAYEVYLRVMGRTDEERIDGLGLLGAVRAAIEARQAPDAGICWQSHTCTNLPSLYRTESGGAATYQLTAQLVYLERS